MKSDVKPKHRRFVVKPMLEDRDVGLILRHKRKPIRKSELSLKDNVYITPEVHKILRAEKAEQQKSMARIACELIIETYGDENQKL
jgi:hypothetical protein